MGWFARPKSTFWPVQLPETLMHEFTGQIYRGDKRAIWHLFFFPPLLPDWHCTQLPHFSSSTQRLNLPLIYMYINHRWDQRQSVCIKEKSTFVAWAVRVISNSINPKVDVHSAIILWNSILDLKFVVYVIKPSRDIRIYKERFKLPWRFLTKHWNW